MSRVFDLEKLKLAIEGSGLSERNLLKGMVREAPDSLMPSRTYLVSILNGSMKPGADYLALFAEVCDVEMDSFFSESVTQ